MSWQERFLALDAFVVEHQLTSLSVISWLGRCYFQSWPIGYVNAPWRLQTLIAWS